MRLLNLCCGSNRPQDPIWMNMDSLIPLFPHDTPERINLENESNYHDVDILNDSIPCEDNYLDGILISHFIEHCDCRQAIRIMKDCYRCLKKGGKLVVSVPDCTYFKKVYGKDNLGNAVELFGEKIHEPDGEITFFDYALWNRFHKAILCEDSLWCYFIKSGFKLYPYIIDQSFSTIDPILNEIIPILNRRKFSLIMFSEK